jgi:uncharacterized protein
VRHVRDGHRFALTSRDVVNLREDAAGVSIEILVTPRASRTALGPIHDGRLKLAVTAAPVDGGANAAVIDALAEAFGVPRGDVEVIRGASSRRKTVRIAGVTCALVEQVVAARSPAR